jgi:hypothetical protein
LRRALRLVFAVNIGHSQSIVNKYLAAGIPAAHVDANTPADERRAIFKRLASRELKIVSNVGIATEGTDIPNADFVQLARPTKSLALFLQMIGRGTRTIYDQIKHAQTDEERRLAVAASSKPYCYVLDNAGLWEEHGLPDQDFNWLRYFNGIDKKKKKAEDDLIEVLEYVAEDDDGRIVRSKNPKEIEGLKLIEISSAVRQKVVNLVSLKEFDREFNTLARIPHIKKPGFAAIENYENYCRRNSILMAAEVWDYLIKRLCTDPQDKEAVKLAELESRIESINQTYSHNPAEARHLIAAAKAQYERDITPIKRLSVPAGHLRKKKAEYLAKESKPVAA